MPRKKISEPELVVSAHGAAAAPARRKPAAATRKPRTVSKAKPVASLSAPVEISSAEPSYDQIALEAYLLWEARGFQGGSPEEDWTTAEQILRSRA